MRVGVNAISCGQNVGDIEHRAPLRKPRAEFCIFGKPLAQVIETFGYFLVRKVRQRSGAFVDFDSRNDTVVAEKFWKRNAAGMFLPNCFVEQNDAADELRKPGRGEQHISVSFGRDASEASPIRGTFKGTGDQSLKVQVKVVRLKK